MDYLLAISPLYGGAAAQAVPLSIGGQAAARRQIKLPAMHRTSEGRAGDLTEPAEISSQMGAPALDDPVIEVDVLFVVALFGIPAFGIHEPVGCQALEERVQVLVVRPDPPGAAARHVPRSLDVRDGGDDCLIQVCFRQP